MKKKRFLVENEKNSEKNKFFGGKKFLDKTFVRNRQLDYWIKFFEYKQNHKVTWV